MVEWLSGNRIIGTSTERNNTTVSTPPTISTDGNYTVLKYTEDGVFIPKGSFNVEYLVVAGGGGGARDEGGGGGAGGYLTGTGHGVTAQNYNITVGAGGSSSGNSGGNTGGAGGNSVFSTITSIGGGGGGYSGGGSTVGASGGSGGGGGGAGAGGSATSGQGYAGGSGGGTSGNYPAGGGGGAGQAGTAGSGSTSGNGGNGLQNDITGTNIYYAGGGGGGIFSSSHTSSGGSGGGGDGSCTPEDGTDGLGGGGGGQSNNSCTTTSAGKGGSGIVIIRFLTSGNDYLTSAELFNAITGVEGGWKELARTTLGSAGDNIDVSSLADKRYLMFLVDAQNSGQINSHTRLNSDSGSNYAYRYSNDGVSDGSDGSQNIMLGGSSAGSFPMFEVSYIANKSDKEKLLISNGVGQNTAGAGNAPSRRETVGKHVQTSNPVSAINKYNGGSGDYASGSEVVVLGWDPADTHTTNFWEELASVELGSAGDDLDSGTFTAKKYLWVQVFFKASGTYNTRMRFNSDSVSNYGYRHNDNGTGDATNAPENAIYPVIDGATTNINSNSFTNMFIVNNSSDEKLIMYNVIIQKTAGASTAPARMEGVGKWANTSSQITSIDFNNAVSGDYDTGSIIKVWGHD